MVFYFRRRSLVRLFLFATLCVVAKLVFLPSRKADPAEALEIRKNNVLDLVSRSDKPLDARRHKFLQARHGRDERADLFKDMVRDGVMDYWERFQKP